MHLTLLQEAGGLRLFGLLIFVNDADCGVL
jgi:hypothetical protein